MYLELEDVTDFVFYGNENVYSNGKEYSVSSLVNSEDNCCKVIEALI